MKERSPLSDDSSTLSSWLEARGYKQLAVTTRGETILVSSVEDDDPRLRFTRVGPHAYGLSIMKHNGRWERTPMIGSIVDAADFAGSIGCLDF